MSATPTKVYPIPGRFAVGVPMVEHELDTKAEAEELVSRTGAFALSEKEANDAAFTTPEGTPADDSNVKPPRPAEEPAPETTTATPPPETTAKPEAGGDASQKQAERASEEK